MDYKPEIGANFHGHFDIPVEPKTADLPDLKNILSELAKEIREFREELEEELSDKALHIPVDDERLIEANTREWPKSMGQPRNEITYPYYRALARRDTASAVYIRERFETAARDVGGTDAVDILELLRITESEVYLTQEFIDESIQDIDDSAEYKIVEIFQEWAHAAERYTRQFRAFYQEGNQNFQNEIDNSTITPEESIKGQAVFLVGLNLVNENIKKDLEFLNNTFNKTTPTFFKKYMGPALNFKVGVKNSTFGLASDLNREVARIANALDGRLLAIVSDHLKRSKIFEEKLQEIYELMLRRRDYRGFIENLSSFSTPMQDPFTQAQDVDGFTEWEESEEFEEFVEESEESFIASHQVLAHRDHPEAHYQYLLHAAAIFTGDAEMDPGVLIDGMRPSTHKHTGKDGTLQIHGDDIIRGSLIDSVVNTGEKPPAPVDLRLLNFRAPPGNPFVEATVEWRGNNDYTYEIQIAVTELQSIHKDPGS